MNIFLVLINYLLFLKYCILTILKIYSFQFSFGSTIFIKLVYSECFTTIIPAYSTICFNSVFVNTGYLYLIRLIQILVTPLTNNKSKVNKIKNKNLKT